MDGFGVFVSASATTEGTGTKASPFKTLARALTGSPRRLFVCAGRYEGVAIAGTVSLHGGFSCSDWSHTATNKVEIAATNDAPALTLKGATSPVFVSDVHVIGKDHPGKGQSSMAAFVASSGKVTFSRVKLEARAGGDAEDGGNGHFTYPPTSSLDGKNANDNGTPYPMVGDDTPGAGGDTGNCPGGGRSTGGAGGGLGSLGQDGTPPGLGGPRGDVGTCSGFAPGGGLGAYGKPGTVGEPGVGALFLGEFTAQGWSGKAGTNGKNGTLGGGGGGGFGTQGTGGGGGAGGCGGAGGGGGSAGGSSIALLISDAEVALVASELIAADAKPGGAGGQGQRGQEGQYGPFGGNRGRASGQACEGGAGGPGGNGGPGGGGAGGVSAGILWLGSKEPLHGSDTKITRSVGPAAAGGLGATNGVSGVNADVLWLR